MTGFVDFCLCSDWDGNGEIYDMNERLVWRFQTSATQRPTVFMLLGDDGAELASVSRERRLPMARFAVHQNGTKSGTIRQRSVWFNRYDFEFGAEAAWKLYMPMFSVRGRVEGPDGAEILIQAHTRKQWFVRIAESFVTPVLMASLAFVTRKKLQTM